jgi:hypothetical protein
MTVQQITDMLKTRIGEHMSEITSCSALLAPIQEAIRTGDKGNTNRAQDGAKLLVLKDRILFNRAALLVYEDLLKEISGHE